MGPEMTSGGRARHISKRIENACRALRAHCLDRCKLAGSRLIVTRTGGWRTALIAYRRTPSLQGHVPKQPLSAEGHAFGSRHLFEWWPFRAFWQAYEQALLVAPFKTQALAMTLIWYTCLFYFGNSSLDFSSLKAFWVFVLQCSSRPRRCTIRIRLLSSSLKQAAETDSRICVRLKNLFAGALVMLLLKRLKEDRW